MTGRWFSSGTLISSTNKTDPHDIAEILLKVALNTINQPFILHYRLLPKARVVYCSATGVTDVKNMVSIMNNCNFVETIYVHRYAHCLDGNISNVLMYVGTTLK